MINTRSSESPRVAYFSMEVGLSADIPTYSGGLGVLAGDTLKSTADLSLPVVAVTLLARKGYFTQSIAANGCQAEEDVRWEPASKLQKLNDVVQISIAGRPVKIACWMKELVGVSGGKVPVYFLDTDVEGNALEDRRLTDHLYGGDESYRIAQEMILGLGGIAMLESLGLSGRNCDKLQTYHMNEGHAAFLTLGLLRQQLGSSARLDQFQPQHWEAVRKQCVFTTHTPVAAGHDRFDLALVRRYLGEEMSNTLSALETTDEHGKMNMTHLALRAARYVNGVAKRHAEVSRQMFPGVNVQSITNGVHSYTWTSKPLKKLFDRVVPQWRTDPAYLRQFCECPLNDLWSAHLEAKRELFAVVKERTGQELKEDIFTIGFARRAATYKRADLLFRNRRRLEEIAQKFGGLQVVFSGKAHPKDAGGKELIRKVVAAADELQGTSVKVVFIPNYDMDLGNLICAGVDVWLNNPVKPMEASGTSGMKAALNGVPSLSTLDGWWVEGWIEGVTGWEIEDHEDAMVVKREEGTLNDETAAHLYKKLEEVVLPLFKNDLTAYMEIMRHSIVLNGSYFQTHRMVRQYADIW